MLISVVDIGSNTVKLVLYRVKDGKIKKVHSESFFLRLLNFLKDGFISREGFERARFILEGFKERIIEMKPDSTIAFGTYVLRVAKNADEFIKSMSDLFDIKVLSGQEEAYLSAVGALLESKKKEGVLFDIGGGSLEVCDFFDKKPNVCKSYPLGTLEFRQAFEGDVLKNDRYIRHRVWQMINPYDFDMSQSDCLIGIGGSIRALKKIFGKKSVKRKKLKEFSKRVIGLKPLELSYMCGITPQRAKTVAVAAIVASELMDIFKVKELSISRSGIREGIVYEWALKKSKA